MSRLTLAGRGWEESTRISHQPSVSPRVTLYDQDDQYIVVLGLIYKE